jgi:hypothetical protein
MLIKILEHLYIKYFALESSSMDLWVLFVVERDDQAGIPEETILLL